MSFYDNYYCKYIAADKATRKQCEDYWTSKYIEHPGQHEGQMIITISLANNYISHHIN